MKKNSFTIFYILVFLAIFLDWEKWNIGNMTTVLLINFIQLAVIILLITLFIWSVIIIIKHWKNNKFHTVLPMIIMCLVICSFTVFPTYEPAMKVNCLVNQSSREHVIELLNQGKLSQSDINEFKLPLIHRLSSHTGSVLVQSNEPYTNKRDKVLFYIHCGSGVSSAIIYSADDEIHNEDFGRYYCSINEIEPKWYMVEMVWKT